MSESAIAVILTLVAFGIPALTLLVILWPHKDENKP